jgi:uncharacterized protein YecT (DUF1311 family)
LCVVLSYVQAINASRRTTVLLHRFFSVSIIASWAAVAAVQAEEYQYGRFVYDTAQPGVLVLNGPIDRDSVENFRKALREHSPALLALNSPGGSVSSGLELSAIINDRKMETYIPSSAYCASACSFLFFAGNPRTTHGNLGVHQFATVSDGESLISETEQVTQEVAGKIVAYMHEYNTPSKVYVRMFETHPDDMYWFTREELHNDGIEISTKSRLPVIAFSNPELPINEEQAQPRTAAATLPSFNCAKASTPAEYSICGDGTLSALDARVGEIYRYLQNSVSASTFAGVRKDQRKWIAKREACQASVACLDAIYRQRIAELDG